jgi:replication factor C subunit 3/5
MANTIPWIEKYRPKNINDIVYHDDIRNTLKKLISNKKFPHTIFFGPPGTGKTSTILACAKEIYGEGYKTMVLELNGSDDRGIKVIREQIKGFSEYNQLFCRGVKLVILDEADSMTYDAQFALRRVIENYTHNTRFCLICNYISKLIPALQSRCITFRFSNISSDCSLIKLKEIINLENIKYDDVGLKTIIEICKGDMRKCINLLQSVSMATGFVNEVNVYKCSGEPSSEVFKNLLNYLTKNSFNEIYNYINNIRLEFSMSLIDLIKRIDKFILNLSLTDNQLSSLIRDLSEIENNLSNGGTDEIQLGSMIACFLKLRYIN